LVSLVCWLLTSLVLTSLSLSLSSRVSPYQRSSSLLTISDSLWLTLSTLLLRSWNFRIMVGFQLGLIRKVFVFAFAKIVAFRNKNIAKIIKVLVIDFEKGQFKTWSHLFSQLFWHHFRDFLSYIVAKSESFRENTKAKTFVSTLFPTHTV
jgi:hypothetical protein